MSKAASLAIGLGILFWAAGASAHTPLCSCYDLGDETILCEGGFSDGSSASGVAMRVIGDDGEPIIEGAMDANSEFEFDRPTGDFKVVFDAGPGHLIEIASSDIH
ncbi:hypothetical protein ABC977_07560 [Thioalkalicoccus limnaeus]|uniref:Uncharacterized protein n=1 Tax=Thioalkalicoccus limnaeus TaxID=120681 RepID=A0ABV4BCN0_9GAMM